MAGDWRDNLLPGSIGGAPIFISDVSVQVGRRTVSTEFPKRDVPAREDLGRRARRYSVTAFVLGPEYMKARDAVVDVLESEGPYLFSHPWQGEFQVILDPSSPVDVKETESEGGRAAFSFILVESGDPGSIRIVPSTSSALGSAAASVVAAGAADLEKDLDLELVGDVLEAAAAAVDKVTDAMDAAKRKVAGALGLSEAAALTDALRDLKTAKYSLLGTPGELMTALNSIIAGTMGLVRTADAADVEPFPGGEKLVRAEAAIGAAADLGAVETVTPPPYPGGPKKADATAAELAIAKALKVSAAANTAAAFTELPLDSTDTATTVLAVLGELLEQLLEDVTTSDALYTSLSDLKTALDVHLVKLSAGLPSLGTFTPTTTTPALLIAYQLYLDPTRDQEIAARNRVPDPNFVAGGVPLQVITDG